MKRFWQHVAVADDAAGFAIALDGRAVRTPKRAPLIIPQPALAAAIAAEWATVDGDIDPRAMPLTGLANAAIDIIAPDVAAFAATIAPYATADLLCYRADDADLSREQARLWNPILDWAERQFTIQFNLTTGVMPADQPRETIARLTNALGGADAWGLAALSPLTSLSGSLVSALALLHSAFDAESLWQAAILDALWQEERWGSDADALAARAHAKREWDAAAQFLNYIGNDVAPSG